HTSQDQSGSGFHRGLHQACAGIACPVGLVIQRLRCRKPNVSPLASLAVQCRNHAGEIHAPRRSRQRRYFASKASAKIQSRLNTNVVLSIHPLDPAFAPEATRPRARRKKFCANGGLTPPRRQPPGMRVIVPLSTKLLPSSEVKSSGGDTNSAPGPERSQL